MDRHAFLQSKLHNFTTFIEQNFKNNDTISHYVKLLRTTDLNIVILFLRNEVSQYDTSNPLQYKQQILDKLGVTEVPAEVEKKLLKYYEFFREFILENQC